MPMKHDNMPGHTNGYTPCVYVWWWWGGGGALRAEGGLSELGDHPSLRTH